MVIKLEGPCFRICIDWGGERKSEGEKSRVGLN